MTTATATMTAVAAAVAAAAAQITHTNLKIGSTRERDMYTESAYRWCVSVYSY